MSDTRTAMSAQMFCKVLAGQYQGKPDDHVISIGHWNYPECDPAKMTIYTLPEFRADISITAGELRAMAGEAGAGQDHAIAETTRPCGTGTQTETDARPWFKDLHPDWQAEIVRLREAVVSALGQHQVGHIHAILQKAMPES